MRGVKVRRPYSSARRQEQAAETRRRILEAARRLFEQHGYVATTLEAIATEAGVATITVYSVFVSKRAILKRLVEIAVGGDEQPIALLDRPRSRVVLAAPDARRQIAMFAADIASIMSRVSPLFEVMRNASGLEPEIGDLLDQLYEGRLHGMRAFVSAVMRNSALPSGMNLERAAEEVWAVTSPDLHRLVTVRLGWVGARYERWLRKSLEVVLLG